jgi:hypothetical protein
MGKTNINSSIIGRMGDTVHKGTVLQKKLNRITTKKERKIEDFLDVAKCLLSFMKKIERFKK